MTARAPASTAEYDNKGERLRAPDRSTAVDAVDAVDERAAPDPRPEVPVPESSLPAPGARIGQYEIIRELGRGGMGAVYAARDTKLGRKVAIKLLNSNNQPELTARFIVEARATARVQPREHRRHPRGRRARRQPVHGARVPPGRAADPAAAGRPKAAAGPGGRAHRAGRARAHRRARPQHRPPRPQARQHLRDRLGDDQGARLRDREARSTAATTTALRWSAARSPPARPTRPPTRQPRADPPGHARSARCRTCRRSSGAAVSGTIDHQTDLWAVGIILFEMVAGQHPLAPREGWDLMVTRRGPRADAERAQRLPRAVPTSSPTSSIAACASRRTSASARRASCSTRSSRCSPAATSGRLRSDESPYAGLKSFQESDAHRFFGRARDVAAAVARLRDVPLLGIVGPSGVGKSSFVRAGVVPALKASGEPWSTLVVRPGRSPMAALAYALAPMLSTGEPPADGEIRRDAPPRNRRTAIVVDRSSAGRRAAVRRARLPRRRAAQPGAQPRPAHPRCSSTSSRSSTPRSPTRASGSRSPRAWPACATIRPRRSGSCCRCAPTSSTTSPRRRRSWPSSPTACSS